MFKRRPEVEPLPDITDIKPEALPYELVQAHRVVSQKIKRRGRVLPKLSRNSFVSVTDFELGNSLIEVGCVDEAVPALGNQTTERFFGIATHIGQMGVLDMQRFHIPTRTYHTVEVGLDAPAHGSLLVYGNAAKFAAPNSGNTVESAFTTGRSLLGPDDTAVSFVGVPSVGPTLETRMAAATEIFQNRVHVISVEAEGIADIAEGHTLPFQESLANGMGNALGHIAAGMTYKQYAAYVQGEHVHGAVLGHKGLDGGMVAAPHLLARKSLYEQMSDGELPVAKDLSFIPIMPVDRRQ